MDEKKVIKIAVVDDKQSSRDKICEKLITLASLLEDVNFIITIYEGGMPFLASQEHYHLILLDYEMPDRDGIQVAEELELRAIRPRVLFISGYPRCEKPMQKATQLRVVHGFIFKADSEEEFQFQVKQVLKTILNAHWIEFKYYFVDSDPAIESKRERRSHYNKKMDAREIAYIESTGKDAVTIYTEDEEFKTTESLKELFRKLPKGLFAYSERRIIVNVGFVCSISKKAIRLITNTELPITLKFRNEFQEIYERYLLEGFGD